MAGFQYPASPYLGHSPNARPGEVAPYPGANYSSSPARPEAVLPGSTTPLVGYPGAQVYPPGHVLEGQLINPRSRGSSPIPAGASPLPHAGVYPQTFPHSPKMQDANQLKQPEGFGRPVNPAFPYAPFDPIRVLDMDNILRGLQIPRVPPALQSHDVQHDDWNRFSQDLFLAWAGQLPVPEFTHSGQRPKNSKVAADLINLWNNSFFLARGIEAVLYRGRERRSGLNAGQIDSFVRILDDDDPSSESSTTSSDSSSDDGGGKSYKAYGQDSAERRRKEEKAEKKRRRREKRARRKAKKSTTKEYTLYITYVQRGGIGGGGYPMPGGY